MAKLRYDDTVTEKKITQSFKGDQGTFSNFRPLAKDSTWDELEDYLLKLVYYYNQNESNFEEVCQALLDRYDADERTDDLKESMRQAW